MTTDSAINTAGQFGMWGWAFVILALAVICAALPLASVLRRARIETRHLRYLAHHDALTGLSNRTHAKQRLTALTEPSRNPMPLALLSIDIDGFTLLSDAMGRQVSDQLLRLIGERLHRVLQRNDVAARLDKDDFLVLRPCADSVAAQVLAQQLIRRLSEPYTLEGQQVTVGVNIGIAMFPRDGTYFDTLCKNADSAVHDLRKQSVNNYRFFQPSMDAQVQRRLALAQDLRDAIADNQLHVHYQPICVVKTGKICGVEALLRWAHPVRGMLSPAEFIPLAEQTGLIVAIGNWVLETACAAACRLPEDIELSVNISPKQFQQIDMPAVVARVLARTGLPPHRLCLEVTESLLIHDTERMLACLADLRRQGVRVSLDDFGTGYSGLSYLRRFFFDKIKIDRAFIRDVENVADVQALTSTIVALGHRLGLQVVAEGIETEAQRHIIETFGCDFAQGYLFSRAVPEEVLLSMPEFLPVKMDVAFELEARPVA
ncbi:bifunctional diguanylate cyclase/phosphodiesterase [Pigmentiphaga aceris]|uniref:Bifunctional diguanylate cyclase/phosphodiesterase n=1 Tax=Pigmentiphaga aceris TaxID=1940612 RepID=A0A5C0B328_9BURK|nr:bifunctional diguanylate cyclase/phosphodiesterase [Pigmentiphaga aceris]QEI07017.1 bifunctional diguanylate cyclase/phosphodiesterase [Pigmentiphaga aceris]